MSEVILVAQLTREFNLFIFFVAPINTIRGFLLVLVSLSFLSSLFLPIGLLIALLRGLCKNICTLGVFPPFTHLGYVAEIFKPLGVSLGASLESRLSPCS